MGLGGGLLGRQAWHAEQAEGAGRGAISGILWPGIPDVAKGLHIFVA